VIRIGKDYAAGEVIELPIPGDGGAHWLVGGSSQAGKSNLAHALIAQLAPLENTAIVVSDPAWMDYEHIWGPRLSCIALGRKGAAWLLEQVEKELEWRLQEGRRLKVRKLPVTPETPRLVVVFDELAMLTLGGPKQAANRLIDIPKEQRKVLLAGDALHLNKDYVRGKHLIFVDDIRITGSHEEKITDFMSAEGLGNTYEFVTFATYTGDDASIEHRLNHSFIRNAADVVRMANTIGREHVVTTRAIRILLKSDTFDSDIAPANPRFIVESHEAAMVKGYNRVPELRENYEKLRSTRMAISGSSIERMLGEMHCGMALA
jgi:hypothetical protein